MGGQLNITPQSLPHSQLGIDHLEVMAKPALTVLTILLGATMFVIASPPRVSPLFLVQFVTLAQ
jgi:hypothetical protein